jgi:putative transposase
MSLGRKRRVISNEFPYHITGRCINRDWFRLPLEVIWEIFVDYLYLEHHARGLKIHAFVLMNNHFHLIATAPETSISTCMCYFMTEVSRQITRLSGRINQTFGAPHHPSLINTYHYFMHAYKYVYRNPVDAGIIDRVEAYPYSTLRRTLGFGPLTIPMEEDTILFDDVEGTLRWLNKKYKNGHREEIAKALKRRKFELPLDRKTREKSELELELS